jgi:RNA methyltransferase, TrmH family
VFPPVPGNSRSGEPAPCRLLNPLKLLTLARDLGRRKARERQGLFVCEGTRAVAELLRSGIRIRGALVAATPEPHPRVAGLRQALLSAGVNVEDVTEREFHSASDTETPQGILAIAGIPERALSDIPWDAANPLRLLILDGIQEPGNVGTLIRTAAALGASATLALPGTVDLWNAKVVRSSVGALFHHLSLPCTWEELDTFRQDRGIALWGADAQGVPLNRAEETPPRLALVVGNEGQGLSAAATARVQRTISLPIAPAVESLNVAVAAGILLYELRR